ncbi:hypothetical protein K501DRAFT_329598 [Backusella circina FSU 941]|nr:hypothetical protein K501DRAFT_329598 [Backusella circina FSU 941]
MDESPFSKDLPQSSFRSEDYESLCKEKFLNPPTSLLEDDELPPQRHDMDWQTFVQRLRAENTSLLVSLKETHEDLMQSRREKHLLEDFIQRQAITTDAIVSRQRENLNKLKDTQEEMVDQHRDETQSLCEQLETLNDQFDKMRQERNELLLVIEQRKHEFKREKSIRHLHLEKLLELVYQKNYLLLENTHLKEREHDANLLLHEKYGITIQHKQITCLQKWRSIVYVIIAIRRFR